MARVTTEDCVVKIPNRFELVMIAAQRAREILSGAPLTIDRDNDKNPVVALREIADETVELENLQERLVKGHQKVQEPEEEPVEDIMELMQADQAWVGVVPDDDSEKDMGGSDEGEEETAEDAAGADDSADD